MRKITLILSFLLVNFGIKAQNNSIDTNNIFRGNTMNYGTSILKYDTVKAQLLIYEIKYDTSLPTSYTQYGKDTLIFINKGLKVIDGYVIKSYLSSQTTIYLDSQKKIISPKIVWGVKEEKEINYL